MKKPREIYLVTAYRRALVELYSDFEDAVRNANYINDGYISKNPQAKVEIYQEVTNAKNRKTKAPVKRPRATKKVQATARKRATAY